MSRTRNGNPTFDVCAPGVVAAMLHLDLLDPTTPITMFRSQGIGTTNGCLDHTNHVCAAAEYQDVTTLSMTAAEYARSAVEACMACTFAIPAMQGLSGDDQHAVQELDSWAGNVNHASAMTGHPPKWLATDAATLWRCGLQSFRNLGANRGAAAAHVRESIVQNLRDMDDHPAFRLARRAQLLTVWTNRASKWGWTDGEYPPPSHLPETFVDHLGPNAEKIRRAVHAEDADAVLGWYELVTSESAWVVPHGVWRVITALCEPPSVDYPRSSLLKVPAVAVKYLPAGIDRKSLLRHVPEGTPNELVYAAEAIHPGESCEHLSDYIAALTAAGV